MPCVNGARIYKQAVSEGSGKTNKARWLSATGFFERGSAGGEPYQRLNGGGWVRTFAPVTVQRHPDMGDLDQQSDWQTVLLVLGLSPIQGSRGLLFAQDIGGLWTSLGVGDLLGPPPFFSGLAQFV